MAIFYSLDPALTVIAPIAIMLGYVLRWNHAPSYYTGRLGTLMFLQAIVIMICCMFELTPL